MTHQTFGLTLDHLSAPFFFFSTTYLLILSPPLSLGGFHVKVRVSPRISDASRGPSGFDGRSAEKSRV